MENLNLNEFLNEVEGETFNSQELELASIAVPW